MALGEGRSIALPNLRPEDRGGGTAPRPGRFNPREDQVPTVQEAGWAPGTGLDGYGKSRPTLEFDPRTVHPVASRYTD